MIELSQIEKMSVAERLQVIDQLWDYYEMEDGVAYVHAILDLRRDPLWIQNRLSKKR